MELKYCQFCFTKECKETDDGVFDTCSYGIVFLNRNNKIEKRMPTLPLKDFSKNLRHEINPILQSIINNSSSLDPELSTKIIDLNNPLSRIVGSTVIIDIIIQMITGINDFFENEQNVSKKLINIKKTVNYYYSIYSIVKDGQKVQVLNLDNQIPEDINVSILSDFLNYMIATLIDNAWKHSLENTTLKVSYTKKNENLFDLIFINNSKIMSKDLEIFKSGVKASSDSRGFGYGLYWLKTLIFFYNKVMYGSDKNPESLIITHEQEVDEYSKVAKQIFTLKNIRTVE